MNLSADLSHAEAFVDGFAFDFFAELRARDGLYWHGPTHLTPDGEGFWVASRYHDVVGVLGDASRFSSAGRPIRRRGGTSIADAEAIAENVTTSEGAPHERIRALVEQSVTKTWLHNYQTIARHRAHDALDRALSLSSFDFVCVTGRELGSHLIFDLLGVPDADRRQIIGWMWGDADGKSSSEGQTKCEAYFRDLVAEKPIGEVGVLGALFRAQVAGRPGSELTSAEILAFINIIYPVGAIACANAMASAVKAFCDAPAQYERLLDSPNALDSSVEEILRWSTPALYARRTARADVELSGSRILAGQKVTGWLASANRDEQVFANASQFDVTRTPNPHLSFGPGPHTCLSAGITRLTLRSFLEAACEQIARFELAGDVAWAADNRFYGLERLPVRLTAS